MDTINVILIKDNNIEENHLFQGADAADQAEKKFVDLCRENLTNFDEYTKDDIDAIIENGYEHSINGKVAIVMNWPQVA